MESQPHLLLYSVQGCFDGTSCLSANMPEKVWSHLPVELLERVLAKLPTTSLLRFRAVCKAWLSLLTSSKFHQLAASLGGPPAAAAPVFSYQLVPGASPQGHVRPPPPLHPLASLAGLAAFSSCEVRKVDLSFLPARVLALGFDGCVAQDGVFCIFETTASNCLTQIVVVNPMTRSWRALRVPLVAQMRRMEEWYVRFRKDDGSSSSFKVMVAWDLFPFWGFAIYTSSSDSWEVSPVSSLGPPPRILHPPHQREYQPDVTSHAITVYCSETGRANYFVLNRLDFSFQIRDLFLVDHEGTVYFVVGYSSLLHPSPVVRIGLFDHHAALPWEQVAHYSLADLSVKFLPRARASFDNCEEFMGLGGAVVLGDSIWLSVGVAGEWHVLEFRIPDKSWHPVLRGPLRDLDYTLWSMAYKLVQPRVDLRL